MTLIENYGNGVEIWKVGDEYFVYGVYDSGDPRVCPSEGMAREVAGGVAAG